MRDALESRGIIVPDTVLDTQASSFISKRVIAAIWHDSDNKVKRDSLLLEYHNIRLEVVRANKDILLQRQAESTRDGLGPRSGPGQSSASRHTQEEISNAQRNIRNLSQEEHPASERELNDDSEEEATQTAGQTQIKPPENNASLSRNVNLPFSDERLAAYAQSIEIIGEPQLDPLNDENITRSRRSNTGIPTPQTEDRRDSTPVPIQQRSQDARNTTAIAVDRHNQTEECSTREILSKITKLLDKMSSNQEAVTQSSVTKSNSNKYQLERSRRFEAPRWKGPGIQISPETLLRGFRRQLGSS